MLTGMGCCRASLLSLLTALAPLVWATASHAQEDAALKEKITLCGSCHGPTGNVPLTPDTPKIGGQYYDYLVHSLQAYKSGKRDNPLMSPMAKPLTEQEIRSLAEFFSKQDGLQHKY